MAIDAHQIWSSSFFYARQMRVKSPIPKKAFADSNAMRFHGPHRNLWLLLRKHSNCLTPLPKLCHTKCCQVSVCSQVVLFAKMRCGLWIG
jgi:hypothetical protein